MPLLRLRHERIYWGNKKTDDHIFNVKVPNMFAGSVLDLEPDTVYEARFVLTDPDGGQGAATHIATVKTRAEPKPATGGRVFHVYPTRLERSQGAGLVRRADVRLQLLLRRRR